MRNSKRHTIFVALGNKKPGASITTRIFLTQGDFEVCDGNGFDPAYNCDDVLIARGDGAVFQLPCNLNIPDDQDEFFPCLTGTRTFYEVWGRALGMPGGSAKITTCAFDEAVKVCSTESTLDVFTRNNGQQVFNNVTKELTSIVFDGARIALFHGDLEDFFWQYENNGLRLAQLRFYVCSEVDTDPDACDPA